MARGSRIRKSKDGVTLNDRRLRDNIRRMKRYLLRRQGLPSEVFKEWKRVTPLGQTGKAKRSNKLRRTGKGYTITGEYPYSGVIDRGEYPNPPANGTGKTRNGYSTQAPDGILDPTVKFIKKTVNKFIRRNA